MLILSKKNVQSVLQMKELIPTIEHALIEFSRGGCIQPEKRGIDFGTEIGLMEVFIGYLVSDNLIAVKTLNSRKENPPNGRPFIYAHISLIDRHTGETVALIEGGSITAARTAAASAVAARHLSRPESRHLALIGTGRQGRTHLETLLQVRPIEQVTVFDISPESAANFKSECEEKFRVDIHLSTSVQEAVRKADIIQLCTTTVEPVVFGEWVEPGTHINSIASYAPTVCEVDTALVQKSLVVTDTRSEALQGAGELVIPLSRNEINKDHLYGEIGEIAAGSKPGRQSSDQITFFKSMGIAVEDVAAADLIYRRARERNIGNEIMLEE